MALEHDIVERFTKRFDNLDKVVYGEGGFVSSKARGKMIGAKTMYYFAKYLFEKKGKEVFFINLTGLYMIKSMQRVGYTIEERIFYKEFEYKGQKPFTEVEPSKYYVDKDPACYLLAITHDKVKQME